MHKTLNLFEKPGKYTAWKILELVTIGLLIGGIMWTINFLHEYAYTTLDNTQAIIILSSGASMETVDDQLLNSAKEAVNLKNALPNIDNKIRNIFYYANENSAPNTPISNKK